LHPSTLYTAGQRQRLLFILFLVGTSNYLDRNIIGVLLEPIRDEFGASDTMLGLLSGLAFALFYATLGIPVARIADRGDRRLVITVSLAVWSMMTVLCGFAQSFWQLALARVGVGAGEAGAIPPAQSLIADYVPPDGRARALGLFLMSSMAGYVLGLVLGGWIAQNHGWRAAFVAAGLPGLLLAVVTWRSLDEPRRLPQYAVSSVDQESVWSALRALLAKPSFRLLSVAMVLYFLMAYGALVFTVSFLIRIHGLSVAQAGLWFGIVSGVGAVIGNIGGGWLADRLSRRNIAWLAWLPAIVLLMVMPLYQAAFLTDYLWLTLALLLLGGIGLTGAVPSLFSAVHHVCGSTRRATAIAILFFLSNLIGMGLGPVLTGSLSDGIAAGSDPATGLRQALALVMFAFVPAALTLLAAGRHIAADAEA